MLLPLRERLREWEDFDVAGFYLGKAMGVIPPEYSFSQAKGMFYHEDGLKLIDLLFFLVDQGFIERRDPHDRYGEFRWRTGPGGSAISTAEDG